MSDINETADKLQIDQWLLVAQKFEELTPRALTVTEKMQVTAKDINKTVGDVNKTVASVNKKIPSILDEVKAVRSDTIPAVLKETSSIRKEMPPMLAQVNQILDKSKELSKQAAEGAVKGVILSPINLIKDAGKGIKSTVTDLE